MGGMEGFGPVEREPGEPLFHAPWERKAFAMNMVTKMPRNLDASRHSIERLDPATYLTADYYGRWLAAVEVRLNEHGLLTSAEVDERVRALGHQPPPAPKATPTRALGPDDPQRNARRSVDASPRFEVGDAVVAADIHPRGHTRLPRYVRGRRGVVAHVHPAFVFPDSHAHGRGEHPQYVYAVGFPATELWGPEADPAATVHVDLFESHLEPAP